MFEPLATTVLEVQTVWTNYPWVVCFESAADFCVKVATNNEIRTFPMLLSKRTDRCVHLINDAFRVAGVGKVHYDDIEMDASFAQVCLSNPLIYGLKAVESNMRLY